jgi:hypothetical protein
MNVKKFCPAHRRNRLNLWWLSLCAMLVCVPAEAAMAAQSPQNGQNLFGRALVSSRDGATGTAQDLPGDSAAGSPTQGITGDTAGGQEFANRDTLMDSPDEMEARQSMPADQIIALLKEQPELLAEAKAQIAQGLSIDPRSIADEDLYSRIRQNAALRMQITRQLRAQGYDANMNPRNHTVANTPAKQLKEQKKETQDQDQDNPKPVKRENPYPKIPSLDDLYSQLPSTQPKVKRFGSDTFRLGTGNADELPMDMPAGPDYVIGPGDGLVLNLWGGISQRLNQTVDRQGQIALPEARTLEIAGLSVVQAQEAIQRSLSTQFQNIQEPLNIPLFHSQFG